jgi:Mn-dependent DtxR family transcriptional regulator
MSSIRDNPKNHVVYNNSELSEIRKYLKDIAMLSAGQCQYEIGKIASIINVGGETVENYFERVK